VFVGTQILKININTH